MKLNLICPTLTTSQTGFFPSSFQEVTKWYSDIFKFWCAPSTEPIKSHDSLKGNILRSHQVRHPQVNYLCHFGKLILYFLQVDFMVWFLQAIFLPVFVSFHGALMCDVSKFSLYVIVIIIGCNNFHQYFCKAASINFSG